MTLLATLLVLPLVAAQPRIINFSGSSEFKRVSLHWAVDNDGEEPSGLFRLKFCENQIWGEHYCQQRILEDNPDSPQFSTDIYGLKMATNYTFYLQTETLEQNSRQQRKIQDHIFLQTKGFTAKAIDCGKDVTEVLVETGPHFRGKISAEGAEQTCFVRGRAKSANTSYILRIDHERCGSSVNKTAVWTYVVVQENLSILTQSTRRFLVLCQYKMPGTFTVKAGFNLPTAQSSPPGSGSLRPVDLGETSRESRESRDFSQERRERRDPPRIITAQSLDSARLSKILAGTSNSASQRNSRTLTNNLFGGRQLGEEAETEDNNHKMWMIVLTVSAGLVVISVMAVLVVCRPASSQQEEELAEISPASSQVNVSHADTEALQPKKKEKKVYRPSESRA